MSSAHAPSLPEVKLSHLFFPQWNHKDRNWNEKWNFSHRMKYISCLAELSTFDNRRRIAATHVDRKRERDRELVDSMRSAPACCVFSSAKVHQSNVVNACHFRKNHSKWKVIVGDCAALVVQHIFHHIFYSLRINLFCVPIFIFILIRSVDFVHCNLSPGYLRAVRTMHCFSSLGMQHTACSINSFNDLPELQLCSEQISRSHNTNTLSLLLRCMCELVINFTFCSFCIWMWLFIQFSGTIRNTQQTFK